MVTLKASEFCCSCNFPLRKLYIHFKLILLNRVGFGIVCCALGKVCMTFKVPSHFFLCKCFDNFFLRNEQLGFNISLKLMKLFSFSYSAAWLMLIRIIARGGGKRGGQTFHWGLLW